MSEDDERSLLELLRRDPTNARVRSNLAAHYQLTGRPEEAVEQHRMAVEADPDDPQLRYNLATALHACGRPEKALDTLDTAVERWPADPMLRYGRGCVLQSIGRDGDAADAYLASVSLQPAHADAWYGLGTVHQANDDAQSAVDCYRRVVALDPDHPAASHMIAALGGVESCAPPPGFVRQLFDNYADAYDEHLTRGLRYEAPARVETALRKALGGDTLTDHLDLGCGTGLFGERIAPIVSQLTGVDVSPGMLAKARRRGCYDNLVESDLIAYLDDCEPATFDAVTAVDVFSYLGTLHAVFRRVHAVLRPAGLFVFTVEAGEQAGFSLGSSGRYRHSAEYLTRVQRDCGFGRLSFSRAVLRTEADRPCDGFVVVLSSSRS